MFWEGLWHPEEPTFVVTEYCEWPLVLWTLGYTQPYGKKWQLLHLVYYSWAFDCYSTSFKRLPAVFCLLYICFVYVCCSGKEEQQFANCQRVIIINQSINQSLNRSINLSIHQSINQSITLICFCTSDLLQYSQVASWIAILHYHVQIIVIFSDTFLSP